jgi:hypothetical protein
LLHIGTGDDVAQRITGAVMVFGHNTNVKMGALIFHVQTEDRGESHALIDSTVYYHGRVLHRRTNNYFDLLPLDEDREQALKLRLDEQHRAVLEEIHNNSLQLTIPPAIPAQPSMPKQGVSDYESGIPGPASVRVARKLNLELMNTKNWLAGKHVTLQISVCEENGDPVHGARVTVEVDGSAESLAHSSETGLYGQAQIEFDMPRITSGEPAIVIHAKEGLGSGHLRFALRAKPRVPTN